MIATGTVPEIAAIPASEGFPNSFLPILVYRSVLKAGSAAEGFEQLFVANGWTNSWRNGIYDFDHFHSTAHEVLGIAAGWAEVRLGADAGIDFRLETGDVVVLPAGMSHRCRTASANLLVIGAYAEGREADLRHGKPDELNEVLSNIANVPLPQRDPVQGESGAMMQAWTQFGR